MASDLSSGCTEAIEILDEKEEGEISLEDVSSSEEGQLNYGCTFRTTGQCPKCLSMQNCALWCAASVKSNNHRDQSKKNAVQEKENHHHTKELGYTGAKNAASTLQEKNNDLVPISSDSDMEIVGLTGSTKQIVLPPIVKTDKVRKKRKKRRAHNAIVNSENVTALPSANSPIPESIILLKRDLVTVKETHLSKSHHKEQNPVHRNSRSSFTRLRVSKSPPRRYRSPPTRLRSPIIHSRSPISRKSPRRLRSPKRSPYRSPVRAPIKKLQRNLSSSSHTYVDMYGNVTKLLKKVRHLEMIGSQSVSTNLNKNKEHGSSLKEKLSNMIKTSDISEGENNRSKVKSNTQEKTDENPDDEDDLAMLRQIALETKQKRTSKSKEISKVEPEKKDMSNSNNDNDYEDLELRMIALRSAVLKKHQNRVQRGLKPGKSKKSEPIYRNESPFTQSFLDSIPIPGEDYGNPATPPHTPIPLLLNENMKPEDMELDTDVEQEKEKDNLPYSLIDDSKQITMETDMLGIKSSDVTFATTNTQKTNNSSFNSPKNNIERYQILNEETTENNAHMHDMTYYSNVKSHSYVQTNIGTYTPAEAAEMPRIDYSTSQKYLSHASFPRQIESLHGQFSSAKFPSEVYSCVNSVSNQETPYSPTDAPMYDSDLPQIDSLEQFPDSTNLLNNFSTETSLSSALNNDKSQKSVQQRCLTAIKLVSNLSEEMNHLVISKCNISNNNTSIDMGCEASQCSLHSYPSSLSIERDDKSSFVSSVISSQESSPNDSMITIDDLPESDSDGSPVIPISAKSPKTVNHISEEIFREATSIVEEPLYLQGIPDVTKDVNKIPTLINRTLVPAMILKTNKQLQRSLPSKKYETYIEPSFKSAEMQPVSIDTESAKISTFFKPIKLAVITKKSQLTPTAFNNVLTDNQTEEVLECEAQKSTEDTDNLENGKTKEVPIGRSSETLNTTNEEVSKNPIITLKNLDEIKVTPVQNEQRMQNDIQEIIKSTTKSTKGSEKSTISKKRKRVRRNRALKKSKHKASGKSQPKDLTSEETVNINSAKSRDTDIVPLYHQLVNSTKLNKSNEPDENILKNNLQQDSQEIIKKQAKTEKELQAVDDVKKCDGIEKSSEDRIKEKHLVKRKRQGNSIKDTKIETNNGNISKSTTKRTDNCTNMSKDSKNGEKNTEKESVKLAKPDKTLLLPHDKNEKRTEENRTDMPIISSNTANDEKTYTSVRANNVVSNLIQSDSNENLNLTKDVNVENATNKKVEIENNRRCSLDEDEEVLRAILLASLAKRSKPSEIPTSTSQATTVLSKLSDTTTDSTAESIKNKIPAKGTKLSVDFVFTPSNDSASSLSSLNSNISTNVKSKLPNVRISNSKIARKITFSNQSSNSSLSSPTPVRKRSSLIAPKGPPKKIMKKAPIPASTKVVNNAKKFQNTLTQKKLNVQKGAMIYSTRKLAENTTVYNKFNENSQSNLQTSSLSETQRFIINLGSDSESESEFEQQKNNVALASSTSSVEKRKPLAIPTSDFEKSVDQFLRDVRKKQESTAATKPSAVTNTTRTKPTTSANTNPTTSGNTKLSTLHATPLAVRHLPASQQEEYRRLKQQILEHERLKLQRALESSTLLLSASSKSLGTSPGPLSPSSPISPLTSKQSQNTKHNSNYMSLSVKDSGVKNVSILAKSSLPVSPLNDANTQSSFIRTNVSNIPQKTTPAFSKTNIPTKPITNISIQIPNETSSLINNIVTINRVGNLNIPINKLQTSSNGTSASEDSIRSKDIPNLTVLSKDQLNLKYVQIQLKQGETGRTVILSDTSNSDKKTGNRQTNKLSNKMSVDSESKTTRVSNKLKNDIVDLASSLEKEISDESVNNVDKSIDDNMAVDSEASTLILSKEENSIRSSEVIDSSASTVEKEISDESVNNVDKSIDDNMAVDSEASTLILSREENSIRSSEVIDSSASTVILSQNETKISDISALPVLHGGSSNFLFPKSTIIRKDRERNKDMWDKIKDDVKMELDVLAALPVTEQACSLTETEHKLVTKRYMVLDNLTEMSSNLRQWEMERDIQTNLVAEVKKLREQLKLAEGRLQAQRKRINSIGPKVTTAHEKINDGRRECFKLTRICSELGSRVIGEHYKLPTAGAQLLNNRLKKVAVRTRQLSKKKVPSVEISTSTDFDSSSVTCNAKTFTSSPKASPCAFIKVNSFKKNLISHNEKEHQASRTEKDPSSELNNKTGEDMQLNKTILLAESNKITDSSSMLDVEQSAHKQYEENLSLIGSRLTSTLNNSNENSDVPQNQEFSRPSTSSRSNYCAMEIKQQNTSEHQTKKNLEPYESVLTHLKVPRNANPNGILCPYELMGTCRDGDCQFIHHSGNQDFINYHYQDSS